MFMWNMGLTSDIMASFSKRWANNAGAVPFPFAAPVRFRGPDRPAEPEARDKAARLYHRALDRAESGLRPIQRAFGRVAEEFIAFVEQQSEREERRRDLGKRTASLVRRFFIPFFADKAVDAIGDHDVARYQEWRKSYWSTGPGKDQSLLEYERGGRRLRRPMTDMRRLPS